MVHPFWSFQVEWSSPAVTPYCSICNKTFASYPNFRLHVRTSHLAEKRFKCPLCERCFTQKSYLRGHMSSHTGMREFVCRLCPRAYVYKKDLKRHALRRHGMSVEELVGIQQNIPKNVQDSNE